MVALSIISYTHQLAAIVAITESDAAIAAAAFLHAERIAHNGREFIHRDAMLRDVFTVFVVPEELVDWQQPSMLI
jgi:hypothetical protein